MDQANLVAWQRSAAMAAPETTLAVKREELLEVLTELIATRALLVGRRPEDGGAAGTGLTRIVQPCGRLKPRSP